MAIAPALIGGAALVGAGIGGGLLSASGSKKSQKRNIRWQREQLQNAIQYRVADAKKAGIHPLYAMGANIQSPTPIEVGGSDLGRSIQEMGQGIGQITQRYQMNWERQQSLKQIEVADSEIRKNDAYAAYLKSQALNPQSSSAPAASMLTDSSGNLVGPGSPVLPGQVNLKPRDQIITNPADISSVAGREPAMQKYDVHPKIPFKTYASQEGLSEVKENIPRTEVPGQILQNALPYGNLAPQYIRDYIGWTYMGIPPSRDWNKVPHSPFNWGRTNAARIFDDIMVQINKGRSEFRQFDERNKKLWGQLKQDYYPDKNYIKPRGY